MAITVADVKRYSPWLALFGAVGAAGLVRATTYKAFNPAELEDAEHRVLRHLHTPYSTRQVQAGPHSINTLIMGDGPPLVMLHGHGGGIGYWYGNLDALAKHYKIYALDWLGWGRSDRPPFWGNTAESARRWWLESFENWRKAVGLEEFYLLGHSLGGWLAAEYAMVRPHHIKHLILENFAGGGNDVSLATSLYYMYSPQRMVQAVGPLGVRLVEYGCADLLKTCEIEPTALRDYYYQLSFAPLSGQLAFERVLTPGRWHLPLMPRAHHIKVPTTVLWGEKDEMLDVQFARLFMLYMPNGRFMTFPEALHIPHQEATEDFNDAVIGVRYLNGLTT